MENLTKDLLNNQIVAMRNLIKKVKVLTIKGLIKKSKKLKKPKGTVGNEPLKKDQKGDRLLMEIHEIKKLNADEVTKFALMHTGIFAEIAKKGSMKDRALARLAEHKLLTTMVTKFRAKYPKWQIQVPSLYHIWEFNKKVMGKNLKPTHKDEATNKKVEEEEKPKKIKCSTKPKQAKAKKLTEPAAPEAVLVNENDEKEVDTDVVKEVINRPSLAQLSKNLKSKQSQDLKKTDGEIEIQRFNLNDDVGIEIPVNNTSKPRQKTDSLDISKKSKVRNSFFISSDNEDEESGQDNFDFDDNDDNDGTIQSKDCLVQKKSSKGSSFSKKFQESKNVSIQNRGNASNMKGSGIRAAKGFTKPQKAPPKVHKQPNAGKWAPDKTATDSSKLATADLHPSWQAKRKQSNTLSVAFEGKKIKFGDD